MPTILTYMLAWLHCTQQTHSNTSSSTVYTPWKESVLTACRMPSASEPGSAPLPPPGFMPAAWVSESSCRGIQAGNTSASKLQMPPEITQDFTQKSNKTWRSCSTKGRVLSGSGRHTDGRTLTHSGILRLLASAGVSASQGVDWPTCDGLNRANTTQPPRKLVPRTTQTHARPGNTQEASHCRSVWFQSSFKSPKFKKSRSDLRKLASVLPFQPRTSQCTTATCEDAGFKATPRKAQFTVCLHLGSTSSRKMKSRSKRLKFPLNHKSPIGVKESL
uniref:Uncharacterized protein n=1 Tax=Branchiostoma floridae TaxID=7739 RepID=C4A112_BRAFL|eukprot:XP_002585515.1 hypothetical protein BRAFLDRAFT_111932 [Branchiostoma floridae]